eukprot:184299_1
MIRPAFIICVTFGLVITGLGCLGKAELHTLVPDAHLSREAVNDGNNELYSILKRIRATKFFRIFKVALNEKCPFWKSNPQCLTQSCSVCKCEEQEIPPQFLTNDHAPLNDGWSPKPPGVFDVVDRSHGVEVDSWEDNDQMWIVQDKGSDMVYIDLERNPHGFTGFSGPAASRIWTSIYAQNCFDAFRGGGFNSLCHEEKVFYRLISGLRSSITAHLSMKTPDSKPNTLWFQSALGSHEDRIDNLYFVFVFLSRVINKARDVLRLYKYESGDREFDEIVNKLVTELLSHPMVDSASPQLTFNEASMFGGDPFHPRVEQFKRSFRNISLIMNCVECEKCRLYGKLQVLGLGTAMKIMFSPPGAVPMHPDSFQRDEIVALVITFAEFTEAIHIFQTLSKRVYLEKIVGMSVIGASFLLLSVFIILCRCRRKKSKRQ